MNKLRESKFSDDFDSAYDSVRNKIKGAWSGLRSSYNTAKVLLPTEKREAKEKQKEAEAEAAKTASKFLIDILTQKEELDKGVITSAMEEFDDYEIAALSKTVIRINKMLTALPGASGIVAQGFKTSGINTGDFPRELNKYFVIPTKVGDSVTLNAEANDAVDNIKERGKSTLINNVYNCNDMWKDLLVHPKTDEPAIRHDIFSWLNYSLQKNKERNTVSKGEKHLVGLGLVQIFFGTVAIIFERLATIELILGDIKTDRNIEELEVEGEANVDDGADHDLVSFAKKNNIPGIIANSKAGDADVKKAAAEAARANRPVGTRGAPKKTWGADANAARNAMPKSSKPAEGAAGLGASTAKGPSSFEELEAIRDRLKVLAGTAAAHVEEIRGQLQKAEEEGDEEKAAKIKELGFEAVRVANKAKEEYLAAEKAVTPNKPVVIPVKPPKNADELNDKNNKTRSAATAGKSAIPKLSAVPANKPKQDAAKKEKDDEGATYDKEQSEQTPSTEPHLSDEEIEAEMKRIHDDNERLKREIGDNQLKAIEGRAIFPGTPEPKVGGIKTQAETDAEWEANKQRMQQDAEGMQPEDNVAKPKNKRGNLSRAAGGARDAIKPKGTQRTRKTGKGG